MVIAFICKMLVIFNGQRRRPGSRSGKDFVREGRQEFVTWTLQVGHRQRLWGEVTNPGRLAHRLVVSDSCLGNWPLGTPRVPPTPRGFRTFFFFFCLFTLQSGVSIPASGGMGAFSPTAPSSPSASSAPQGACALHPSLGAPAGAWSPTWLS